MPIYLPPLTRRRFLFRTLLAGAGLAASPRLWASEAAADTNSWALLADTHIAADRERIVRGIKLADHLVRVGRELSELNTRPAGAFVLGDCAYNSGETGDYAAFSDLLKPIRQAGIPVHLALGNHDHRERFLDALEGEKDLPRPVAEKQVVRVRSPRVHWYLLDSLEKTLSTPGLLGSGQLSWLKESLDSEPEMAAVILVHHNPSNGSHANGLKDTEELLKVIRPRKQVKAWVFGHTHDWNVKQDESGIHLINLPPVAYVFGEGKPSGWIRATVRQEGVQLEMRCVAPDHKAHGRIHDLTWRV